MRRPSASDGRLRRDGTVGERAEGQVAGVGGVEGREGREGRKGRPACPLYKGKRSANPSARSDRATGSRRPLKGRRVVVSLGKGQSVGANVPLSDDVNARRRPDVVLGLVA